MALTVQQQLNIANACSIYASNELVSGKVDGGLLDERLPSLLFATRQGLEWLYELDPTNEDLTPIGNGLIAICKHYAKAENEIVGGGSVPSVNPNTALPQPIDWRVSGTASATAPLATADTSVVLDGTNGMPDLRGYNVAYTRGGIPQYTTNPGDGSNYYGWDRLTGLFQLLGSAPSAVLGEQMRIDPIS